MFPDRFEREPASRFWPVVVVFAVVSRLLGLHRVSSAVYEQLPIPGGHLRSGRISSLHGVTSLECFLRQVGISVKLGGQWLSSGHRTRLDRSSKEGGVGGIVHQLVLAEQAFK